MLSTLKYIFNCPLTENKIIKRGTILVYRFQSQIYDLLLSSSHLPKVSLPGFEHTRNIYFQMTVAGSYKTSNYKYDVQLSKS